MVENNNKKPDKQPATKPRRSYARVTGLVILWLFVVGLMGALFVGGTAMGYVAYIVKDEPVRSRELIDQKMGENAITSFAYFRDQQTPIGQIRTDEDQASRRIQANSEISHRCRHIHRRQPLF